MGQKLDKSFENDEDLLDNSDWSARIGGTPMPGLDTKDQQHDSFVTPKNDPGVTVTVARTDPQTGQPITGPGQSECPLNTNEQQVGGVDNKPGTTRAAEGSKSVLSVEERRHQAKRPNNKHSAKEAVVCFGTTAMEGQRKDLEGRAKATRDENEEDFVVLERDESWVSTNGEKIEVQSSRIRLSCQEAASSEKKSLKKSTGRVEVTAAESEIGSHSVDMTDSRCQLKAVSPIGTTTAETTGGGTGELGDQSAREVRNAPIPKSRGLMKRIVRRKTNDECEIIPCEPAAKTEAQEEEDPDRANYKECFSGSKTQETSRFAGAVSRRANAGCVVSRKDCQSVANSAKPSSSSMLQQKDDPTVLLEQCDAIPDLQYCNGAKEVASFKKESEFVSFSAVINPPPQTHIMAEKDSQKRNEQDSKTTLEAEEHVGESLLKESSKAKGPPPPVPKKPKNPFIKVKRAQLMSTDVTKRGKDHHRSEEKVKRRHTFHFNKDLFGQAPLNQDMCQLWDERGTYYLPANVNRLSVDLSPWEELSRVDNYGGTIDFDYCARIADLSPDEEPRDLDMLQRRVFLERRSRNKSSPQTVAKKPANLHASVESFHVPETSSEQEIAQTEVDAGRRQEFKNDLKVIGSQVSQECSKVVTVHNDDRGDLASYKPVAEIVKETNKIQRHSSFRTKTEGPKSPIRVVDQSVNVSQMKNTFDVPKKSKERPQEAPAPPKKGKQNLHCG